MYPLNVSLPAPAIGYAVANDADEHARLTAAGYVPALAQEPDALDAALTSTTADEIVAVRAQLDAAGIKYHPNTGLAKLKALLPAT